MLVSAYTCHPDECGKPLSSPNFCRTASGWILLDSDAFKSVAADNSIFRFGTRITIHHSKGDLNVIVRDTGGDIKGNRLDLFVGQLNQRAAYKWGVQKLEVTIHEY